MSRITIALDAMSGDLGPAIVIAAAQQMAARHPEIDFKLFGQQDVLRTAMQQYGVAQHPQLQVCHAEQVVGMDDPPALALRGKRQSSMRLAINALKDQQADACVSAGNTGALMGISRFVLRTLTGIDRPAIMTCLPTLDGLTHVLDLGANVDCSAEHLLQFAVMGSVLAKQVDQRQNPRVALLNIGEEDIKGNEQVKAAAKRLAQTASLNYIGFVEGDGIYSDVADVIVCDGFVGNIALKTSEGLAVMIVQSLKRAFQASLWGRLTGLLAMPVLKKAKKSLDPRRYNGASLVGLTKTVIKSHGSADELAFASAIATAIEHVKRDIPGKIHEEIIATLRESAIDEAI